MDVGRGRGLWVESAGDVLDPAASFWTTTGAGELDAQPAEATAASTTAAVRRAGPPLTALGRLRCC